MSSLIISISKTKKIKQGFNITTAPPIEESEDTKKKNKTLKKYEKNDIHISSFKFTEEMLEVLKMKLKTYLKENKGCKTILFIDFTDSSNKGFSIELLNRLCPLIDLNICLVILSETAYKDYEEFNDKIKFECLIYQFDFPMCKNEVDCSAIVGLRGVFHKSGNVLQRKLMEYEK